MNKKLMLTSLILIIFAIFSSLIVYSKFNNEATRKGVGYEECAKAGNPIAMSDPPQCDDEKGTHYYSR